MRSLLPALAVLAVGVAIVEIIAAWNERARRRHLEHWLRGLRTAAEVWPG